MKTLKGLRTSKTRERVWRSGESTRLPPMWPGFDSRTRCQMWVEFVVGSRISFERFFFSPGTPFSPSSKTNIPKSKFDRDKMDEEPPCGCATANFHIYIFIFIFKNHTLFRGTYLYSSYMGLPPPKLSSLEVVASGKWSEVREVRPHGYKLVCNRFKDLFMYKSISNPAAL